MKTAYKYILLGLLTSFPLASSFAQTRTANDSTLNRQILLEKEFDPTVKDASKISTLPAIHEPVVKQANVQYETKQPMVNFNNFPVGDTGPGDVKTEIDYNKKRGYLSFGAGTYSNMEGTAGYRIVDTTSDQLDFFARYSSTNGKVKYAEKGYDLDKAKAKFNDILVGLRYQHNFSNMSWHLGGGYENMGFNYYGNSFGNLYGADLNTKQSVDIINVETGIKSMPNNESVKFDGLVKYNNFSTKYGPSSTVKDGVSGNIIEGQFNIGAYFDGSTNLVGIRLNALNQSFGDVDFTDKNEYFHSLTKLAATPHFDIEGDDYTLSLGVKASYAIDDKNKFLVSPDVRFSWQFAESSSFYGNIGGGINENTYVQMLQKCRYIDPSMKVAYSQTIVDGVIGVKSGIVEGLEFDIFGGYKQTNDDHLFIYGYTDTWGNTPTADYYDVGTGHFGGLLKTNLIPYTDLSVKAVGYFYNVDGDEYDGGKRLFKPWNLPTMTFDANIDVKPIENLTISAAYHLAAGRKALLSGDEKKMKNINELNFRAEYQIADFVSVYGKLNNVLNQKYDSFYGYTHQGFNVLGGIAFKF